MHQTSNVTLGEHGAACWDESFPEARATLPCDAAQCPDVFINVNYVNASTKGQTQRLGYIRLKMQECYGFNHAQQWNTLERDPLYPEWKDGLIDATRFGKASDELEENRVLACLAMQAKFYSLLVCEKGEAHAPKPALPASLLMVDYFPQTRGQWAEALESALAHAPEDEALQAMGHAFNRLKVVAEPGGAVALAAALFRGAEIEGDDVIVTISGGNVDADMFARALQTLG